MAGNQTTVSPRRLSSTARAWASLPLSLVKAGLALLRPDRLLIAALLAVLAAAAPSALALWQWDSAVAWVQGELLANPWFSTWLARTEAAGWSGLRVTAGPVAIGLLWLPAVLGLAVWLNSVVAAPRLSGPGVRPAGAWGRAGRAALDVLVFWLAWLLAWPLIWLPLVGTILPWLAWSWLLARRARSDSQALLGATSKIAGPVGALALMLGVVSVVPPLALLVPAWMTLGAAQVARRMAPESEGDNDV